MWNAMEQSVVWVAYRWPIEKSKTHGYPLGIANLFSNQMLSDKKHIAWKLLYFCIDHFKHFCNIENAFRFIEGSLKSFQTKCFEISLIFHGLLLWLQKKIEMKILVIWSQESLKKIHGYPFQCSAMEVISKSSLSNFVDFKIKFWLWNQFIWRETFLPAHSFQRCKPATK